MILKTASPLYAAALISLLTGCATQYVATSKPLLTSVKPVCISKDDTLTEGTAQQIEGNNLALSSLSKANGSACKQKPANR